MTRVPRQYINVQNGNAQFCSKDLGFEVDVYITTSIQVMTRIWYGDLEMLRAIDNELMCVVGNRQYTQSITRWLRISSFTGDNPQFVAPDWPL